MHGRPCSSRANPKQGSHKHVPNKDLALQDWSAQNVALEAGLVAATLAFGDLSDVDQSSGSAQIGPSST